jgi:uncharacterized protein DUF5670
MLWTVSVILIVLWTLGIASAYTMGEFIHILLIFAVLVVAIQLTNPRRVI